MQLKAVYLEALLYITWPLQGPLTAGLISMDFSMNYEQWMLHFKSLLLKKGQRGQKISLGKEETKIIHPLQASASIEFIS